MIVNVKDKNHFKQYKENLFYHIPIAALSKLRPEVEYLAFYQSKATFGEYGGIRYYGKIKSCREYLREECVELKVRAGTEKDIYLRIDLEELKEVNKIEPIQFGTRLISYTTMYLLKNSENTQELKLGNSLELEVYKIMKKISKDKNLEIKKISSKVKNDEEEIINEYSIGGINIKIDGKIIKLEDKETAFDKFENELYNSMYSKGDIRDE